jgi:hypothetical protein
MCPTPLAADPIDLVASLFGDLKQSDVSRCGGEACGPVAAVNSFVFLQNQYPEIYADKTTVVSAKLVGVDYPDGHPPPLRWESLAADILAMPEYMDTCNCGGTPIEKFILGKSRYIEKNIPGRTRYGAQIATEWRPDVAGTADHEVPKPDYVNDGVFPTLDFIRKEISHREDIELYLDFIDPDTGKRTGVSHYITLTALDAPDDVFLGFIDSLTGRPADGSYEVVTEDLGGFLGKRRFIQLTYQDPVHEGVLLTARVTGAITESPMVTPEPTSLSMLALGTAVLARRARIRRRSGL